MDSPTTSQPLATPPVAPRQQLTPIGELLRSSWQYFESHFVKILKITLLSWVAIFAVSIVAALMGATTSKVDHLTPLQTLVLVIYLIVVVAAACWQQAALIYSMTPEGEAKSSTEVYQASKPWLGTVFLAALVSGVLVAIGFILLIIPGVILAVWFCMSAYVIVHENKSSIEALKTSRHLVKGRFWPVLARLLILIVIAIIISIIVSIISSTFGQTIRSFLNLVVSLFLTPFIIIYLERVYRSLKQAPV